MRSFVVGDQTGELSWPLVERRRGSTDSPVAIDRRVSAPSANAAAQFLTTSPPLYLLRWLTLILGVIQGFHKIADGQVALWLAFIGCIFYAAWTSFRAMALHDSVRHRRIIIGETILTSFFVCLTGGSSSPIMLMLIATVITASLAAGLLLAGPSLCVIASALIAHDVLIDGISGLQKYLPLWLGLLCLCAVFGSIIRRSQMDTWKAITRSGTRFDQLALANELLVSLHKVALNLPVSLDLEMVLDQSVSQIKTMVQADVITILLHSSSDGKFVSVRGRGSSPAQSFIESELVLPVRDCLAINRSHRVFLSTTTQGIAKEALCGVYTALRARGAIVGILATEWNTADGPDDHQVEMLTGIADALGIAIDNANLFKNLRMSGANDERRRIARDLHDRTGSSLAFVGFEIDRLRRNSQNDEQRMDLDKIRTQITAVLTEVREMLYDLRAGENAATSLRQAIEDFSQRVRTRSDIQVELGITEIPELSIPITNEIWNIVKESMMNAERHSGATKIGIATHMTDGYFVISVSDNGRGFSPADRRTDSFGLTGMHERTQAINGDLAIESHPGGANGGTKITLTVPLGTPQAAV